MNAISIFNHVLGPVMRGPSSSHTAGAFHIGAMARSLLGRAPATATISFDEDGSYAKCFRQQSADLAFAAGLLGWPIADDRFPDALEAAARAGLRIDFAVGKLAEADHPNAVDVELTSAEGRTLAARANSVGGGAIELIRLAGWPVRFTGDAWEAAAEVDRGAEAAALELLARDGSLMGEPERRARGDLSLLCVRRRSPLSPEARAALAALPGLRALWAAEPVLFVQRGEPIFASAADAVRLCGKRGVSLGRLALEYEATLLGLSEGEVLAEMGRRFGVMRRAVERGLGASPPRMQLLAPSAGRIMEAETAGRLAVGGLHARAAARALAAMHVSSGAGRGCGAPARR